MATFPLSRGRSGGCHYTMLRPLSPPCILLDASFVFAIRGSLHKFTTADFFNDTSAKPLPNQSPNTQLPDRPAKGKTRLDQRFSRAARLARVFNGCLAHGVQIVTFFPSPINFLPDAMVLVSNYMRPEQTTACLRLAWFAVWTPRLFDSV